MRRVLLTFLLIFLAGAEEHIVYWNSSNPLFREPGQPMIEVRMGDVVRFVCPDNDRHPNSAAEFLTVYEVGELAMDECSLETLSREVIRCAPEGTADKVIRTGRVQGGRAPPKNVAQLIRPINPIPNGKEFQIGQTYYYLTTSKGTKEGIDTRSYGLCESRNMRLAMRVVPASTPKPVETTRRQEDFVTKSSAELMGEDEDSEHDDAHLLPRDLENPKFRRPSQLEQAAASAGVLDRQFLKFQVMQMAKEGKTGTFENERTDKSGERDGKWSPVNVQYVADLMNNAYQNVDASLYQREPDFEIHEDNDLAVKSLEYSSSSARFEVLLIIGMVMALVRI